VLAPVKTKGVALLGLVCMVPIALGLMRSTLTLDEAAQRAIVLLVVLAVVDRLVVPLAASLLGPPKRREEDLAREE
jgi:hypothetical protein